MVDSQQLQGVISQSSSQCTHQAQPAACSAECNQSGAMGLKVASVETRKRKHSGEQLTKRSQPSHLYRVTVLEEEFRQHRQKVAEGIKRLQRVQEENQEQDQAIVALFDTCHQLQQNFLQFSDQLSQMDRGNVKQRIEQLDKEQGIIVNVAVNLGQQLRQEIIARQSADSGLACRLEIVERSANDLRMLTTQIWRDFQLFQGHYQTGASTGITESTVEIPKEKRKQNKIICVKIGNEYFNVENGTVSEVSTHIPAVGCVDLKHYSDMSKVQKGSVVQSVIQSLKPSQSSDLKSKMANLWNRKFKPLLSSPHFESADVTQIQSGSPTGTQVNTVESENTYCLERDVDKAARNDVRPQAEAAKSMTSVVVPSVIIENEVIHDEGDEVLVEENLPVQENEVVIENEPIPDTDVGLDQFNESQLTSRGRDLLREQENLDERIHQLREEIAQAEALNQEIQQQYVRARTSARRSVDERRRTVEELEQSLHISRDNLHKSLLNISQIGESNQSQPSSRARVPRSIPENEEVNVGENVPRNSTPTHESEECRVELEEFGSDIPRRQSTEGAAAFQSAGSVASEKMTSHPPEYRTQDPLQFKFQAHCGPEISCKTGNFGRDGAQVSVDPTVKTMLEFLKDEMKNARQDQRQLIHDLFEKQNEAQEKNSELFRKQNRTKDVSHATKVLPTFDGSEPIKFGEFLDKFQECKSFAGWDEKEALHKFQLALSGDALYVYNNFNPMPTTVEGAKTQMIQHFARDTKVTNLYAAFSACTQEANEPIKRYHKWLQNMASVAFYNLPDETRKHWIFLQLQTGLYNTSLRDDLVWARCKNTNDLLDFVDDWESRKGLSSSGKSIFPGTLGVSQSKPMTSSTIIGQAPNLTVPNFDCSQSVSQILPVTPNMSQNINSGNSSGYRSGNNSGNRQNQNNQNRQSYQPKQNNQPTVNQQPLNQSNAGNQQNRVLQGHCRQCGQFGHPQRLCPYPAQPGVRFCGKCGSPDHAGLACPNANNQVEGGAMTMNKWVSQREQLANKAKETAENVQRQQSTNRENVPQQSKGNNTNGNNKNQNSTKNKSYRHPKYEQFKAEGRCTKCGSSEHWWKECTVYPPKNNQGNGQAPPRD